ncbi:unnamed protein product [Ilex paraguariensis]|uniref:Histone acetyltransferase n=1 Tax=Ilex paraguariensis TaxID=185542 RepID=A0ABC8TSB5_9AQUA
MPRPGRRPYECVRRAWHSDWHKPMRGSIIQQIFRFVHERHSTTTKKNKEWQEKLPVVVLKAEEIMYSKADSEADYTDLNTVWDRANEAINIIIRRDESTETGELLPPCVEAALTLGCVPIRESRSQRHSNPRSYLSPITQAPGSVPRRTLDNTTNERNPTIGNQLIRSKPTIVNSAHLISDSNRHTMPKNNNPTSSHIFPSSAEVSPPPRYNQFIPLEKKNSLNVGSVYPSYYGSHFQPEASQMGSHTAGNLNSIIVGTPIFPSTAKPGDMGCLQNLLSYDRDACATNIITQAYIKDNYVKQPEMGCDLSLRLGTSLDSCMSREKGLACEIDVVRPSSYLEEVKLSDLSPPRNK